MKVSVIHLVVLSNFQENKVNNPILLKLEKSFKFTERMIEGEKRHLCHVCFELIENDTLEEHVISNWHRYNVITGKVK